MTELDKTSLNDLNAHLRGLDNYLSGMIDRITRPIPDHLFHYTSMGSARAILESGVLRARCMSKLDDQTELRHALGAMSSVVSRCKVKATGPFKQALELVSAQIMGVKSLDQVYSVSFCGSERNYALWGDYGDQRRGACIALNRAALATLSREYCTTHKTLLVPVCYSSEMLDDVCFKTMVTLKEACEAGFQVEVAVQSVLWMVEPMVPMFKYSGWADQKEWRFVKAVHDEPARDFIEIPLEVFSSRGGLSLILGEDCDVNLRAAMIRDFSATHSMFQMTENTVMRL